MKLIKLDSHSCWIGHLGEPKNIHLVEKIDEGLSSCPLWVYRYWYHNKWWYKIGYEATLKADIEFAKQQKHG